MIESLLRRLKGEPRRETARILQTGLGLYLLIRCTTEFRWVALIWGGGGWGEALDAFRSPIRPLDFGAAGLLGILLVVTSGAMLIVGRFTRVASLMGWLALAFGDQIAPHFGDAGDGLARLLLFYSIFFMSVRGESTAIGRWLHNLATYVTVWQICLVYFSAAAAKMAGTSWIHGTATYFIFNSLVRGNGPVPAIWMNPLVVGVTTYGTLLFQIWFPISLKSRFRRVSISLALAFHLLLVVVLGLVTFGLIMISADLFLCEEDEIRRATELVVRTVGRFRAVIGAKSSTYLARQTADREQLGRGRE